MTASPAPDLSPAEAIRERVARAIYEAEDGYRRFMAGPRPHEAYRRLADAAIAVLAPAPDSGGEAAISRVLALADELDREGGTQLFHGPHNWNRHTTARIRAAVNGDPS